MRPAGDDDVQLSTGELRGHLVGLIPAVPGHVAELKRVLHTPEVEFRWGAA
jgi:hypothetical protein